MRTKGSDYRKVDNKYTTAIGMSVWRYFNIGKHKHQEVKKVCYLYPDYITWCLNNWEGFSLTSHERFDYVKGLKRQLEKSPNNEELIMRIRIHEILI